MPDVTANPAGIRSLATADAAAAGPGRIATVRYEIKSSLRWLWWASVPVWSIGLLAFVPFLRLAFARRRTRDWAVAGGYLAAVVAEAGLVSASVPVTGVLVIGLMGVGAAHAAVAFRSAGPVKSGSAGRYALRDARARIASRSEARRLMRDDPVLARELRIGRPDLPRSYNDGGLVDVNHVPGYVLAGRLGLTSPEVSSVLQARDQLGGRFTTADELLAYTTLAPYRVEELRELMIFG
jgi:hypothetical protein